MNEFEISGPAALAVAALQRRGYLGFALLSDPMTGHLVLFRSQASGCECVALGIVATAGGPHELAELPALHIADDATPTQAIEAATAELRLMTQDLQRMTRRKIN